MDATKRYTLGAGTVQPYACCDDPFWMFFFGMAEYSRDKPVLTESVRKRAQPIINALNAGTITTAEAEGQLKEIWF